jgi:hypothetical protein
MNTDGFLGDICPVIRVHRWFILSVSCLSGLRGVYVGLRVAWAFLLELERFIDCGFRFADRGLEEGAGGDDNQVGRARISCEAVSGFSQRAEDVLGVNLVLGTAEEDEASGIANDECLMTNQVPMA